MTSNAVQLLHKIHEHQQKVQEEGAEAVLSSKEPVEEYVEKVDAQETARIQKMKEKIEEIKKPKEIWEECMTSWIQSQGEMKEANMKIFNSLAESNSMMSNFMQATLQQNALFLEAFQNLCNNK